jgi:predicted dehydrogenase/threonine dehydrogenase-like Zn-dependent dehydrogenase
MLQVVQYQKSGEMLVEELPAPECPPGGILVRTAYSLISAGTEKTSVFNAQSSMIQRAKKQPEQVKMVMDYVKKEGIKSTYQRVKSKLEDYKMLGYSASGIVVETKCDEFAVGDRVACAGAGYANHAEYIAIPKNLACKIPVNVSLEEAAYTTLGSIAMQGVRQANVRLGENVAVIGLGLLGQITVQLLKASGCHVIGMDINEELFEKAKKYGCDAVYPSNADNIKNVNAFTGGLGCDAVILTASTNSNEPMELAIQLARKKGKVVVVGAVGMDIPRSPFYQKELDITISCSYGPGRYDPFYEELGQDYPPAWVRWTENRNMQSVLDLIAQNKLDVKSMTSHTFDIKDAVKAYDIITGKTNEKFLGILLHYTGFDKKQEIIKRTFTVASYKAKSEVKIGFLGAGTFGQTYLIPNLQKAGVDLVGVSTAEPVTAQSAAKKFGFSMSSTDSIELINHKDINTIFCATRHDTHAKFVIESMKAGKPVYVEKPLAVNREEFDEIDKAVKEHNGRVMVGYNRRFSKPFTDMKKFFSEKKSPMSILYRVNAGYIPKGHWAQRPEHGGRIIGEGCHFIDCMIYMTDAIPISLHAMPLSIGDNEMRNRDNVVITIKFNDGSVGTLQYLANGDKGLPKEYCEVFCEGSSAIMNDFRTLELYRNAKLTKKSYDGRKGHMEEVFATIETIKQGKEMPIGYDVLKAVSLATFAAEESMDSGGVIEI